MIDRLSWLAIYPEIVLLAMACVILLMDLMVKGRLRTPTYLMSLLTLAVVAALTAFFAQDGKTVYGFGGLVVSDPMSNWLKCFAALSTIVCFVYGRAYAADRGMLRGGELFSMGLLSLLGAFVMVSANNFLLIYLGLELMTLSAYALVALRRDDATATEAAMKYFVLGALASGFLLYGLSLLYCATGTLDIGGVRQAIEAGAAQKQVLVFGLVFVVAGLAFKFGVAPFHMWLPDVYQGAPTAITLMIGSAPKIAAFAMAIRLLVEGLLPLAFDWQQMLALLAIASLLLGNLAAIAQTNLKRMLAYSTIAQMSFVLMGLMAGVTDGNPAGAENAYSSAMFYTLSYVLTTLVSFGVIMLLARQGFESEEIADFAGLNQRSPLFAGIMLICLFSLAGIPPMVGFQAKLGVIQALVSTGQSAYIALAVFAIVMSLIAAFYYLRVIKVMYFDAPAGPQAQAAIAAPADLRAVLTVNGLLVLGLGLLPGALMEACRSAIAHMLNT